jgi:hypothetical protein
VIKINNTTLIIEFNRTRSFCRTPYILGKGPLKRRTSSFTVGLNFQKVEVMKNCVALLILIQTVLFGQNKFTLSQSEFVPAAGFVHNRNHTSDIKYGVRDFGTMAGKYFMVGPITKAEKQDLPLPTVFDLEQNYPNPFNQATTLTYHLARPGQVYVAIYSILGQEVAVLANGFQQAGSYLLMYDGLNRQGTALAGGVYLLRMHTEGFCKTIKLAVVRGRRVGVLRFIRYIPAGNPLGRPSGAALQPAENP